MNLNSDESSDAHNQWTADDPPFRSFMAAMRFLLESEKPASLVQAFTGWIDELAGLVQLQSCTSYAREHRSPSARNFAASRVDPIEVR